MHDSRLGERGYSVKGKRVAVTRRERPFESCIGLTGSGMDAFESWGQNTNTMEEGDRSEIRPEPVR